MTILKTRGERERARGLPQDGFSVLDFPTSEESLIVFSILYLSERYAFRLTIVSVSVRRIRQLWSGTGEM